MTVSDAETIRQMMRDRFTERRAEALEGGYFWQPCPLCGEPFGGHEWRGRIQLPSEGNTTWGVCLACELELGAQAAAICERDGHSLVSSMRGDVESAVDGSAFRLPGGPASRSRGVAREVQAATPRPGAGPGRPLGTATRCPGRARRPRGRFLFP